MVLNLLILISQRISLTLNTLMVCKAHSPEVSVTQDLGVYGKKLQV